jgi:hypothetical protein
MGTSATKEHRGEVGRPPKAACHTLDPGARGGKLHEAAEAVKISSQIPKSFKVIRGPFET